MSLAPRAAAWRVSTTALSTLAARSSATGAAWTMATWTLRGGIEGRGYHVLAMRAAINA